MRQINNSNCRFALSYLLAITYCHKSGNINHQVWRTSFILPKMDIVAAKRSFLLSFTSRFRPPSKRLKQFVSRCSSISAFLKMLQNSCDKTCVGGYVLIKLHAGGLRLYWKIDLGAGLSHWLLGNFKKHFIYDTRLGDCFWS